MNFKNHLSPSLGCDNVDIRFLADSYLVAKAEDCRGLAVGIERKVVNSAIGKTISVVCYYQYM